MECALPTRARQKVCARWPRILCTPRECPPPASVRPRIWSHNLGQLYGTGQRERARACDDHRQRLRAAMWRESARSARTQRPCEIICTRMCVPECTSIMARRPTDRQTIWAREWENTPPNKRSRAHTAYKIRLLRVFTASFQVNCCACSAPKLLSAKFAHGNDSGQYTPERQKKTYTQMNTLKCTVHSVCRLSRWSLVAVSFILAVLTVHNNSPQL